MSAVALPIQHVHNVVEASAFDTPVVIHCIGCSRSRKADPALIARKLGPLPFGLIVGVFFCKGCTERVSVVLPWYAPTPREWAKIARDHLPKREEPKIHIDGRHIPFHIEVWRVNHTVIDRTLAYIDNAKVAHAAFDLYVEDNPRDDLALRQGTLVLRDSRRPNVRGV